jgi:rare lipoprotein A
LTGNYAAHRTLPCGTRVRVSRDGTTITVVIKDRGPYVSGRGLDLSKAAFSELESPRSGVVWVKYRRVVS